MKAEGPGKIVVIGGGPGGYPAAIRAAQLGADAVLVDNNGIGGACLHRGCIPTKFLLKSAREYRHLVRLYGEMSGDRLPPPDLAEMIRRKNDVVEYLSKGTSSLLGKNGVRIVSGTASFTDPGTVRIRETGEVIQARSFIVATGSETIRPPLEGTDLPGVLDSDRIGIPPGVREGHRRGRDGVYRRSRYYRTAGRPPDRGGDSCGPDGSHAGRPGRNRPPSSDTF